MSDIVRQPFGKLPDGELVDLYTLTGSSGLTARVMTYGAILTELHAPDAQGRVADVVLGHDTLEEYLAHPGYYGATVGRFANRIANGRFTLDGKTYELAVNNGPNALHGGKKGFNSVLWSAEELRESGRAGVRLIYVSGNGEEGYPGELTTHVTYWVNDSNDLRIDYEAATTRATVVNLTNHSYFNLRGQGDGEILDHVLTVNADRFTPFNENKIPTGELKSVHGTALDFTAPTPFGARINADDPQIKIGGGYDHNYVLNKKSAGELSLAASIKEPLSGRTMECWTREPGMQLYTGTAHNAAGKKGRVYNGRASFCFETQHYPDSPNHPDFPTTILRPEGKFESTTIYRFIVA